MNAPRPPALVLSAVIALGLAARVAHAAPEPAPPVKPANAETVRQLEQVEKQLQNADENIRFVETQFTRRPEPSAEEALERRLSDGEIQYLLGDWTAASVLFYDLVSDPDDGRSILVTLTGEGKTRVDAAITRLVDAEAVLLATLSRGDRERLAGLLRKLSLGFDV